MNFFKSPGGYGTKKKGLEGRQNVSDRQKTHPPRGEEGRLHILPDQNVTKSSSNSFAHPKSSTGNASGEVDEGHCGTYTHRIAQRAASEVDY